MGSRLLSTAAAMAIAALALFASAAAGQVPPLTLSGEIFTGTTLNVSAECHPDATSTISFSTSGTAAGPYTGTFTEVGTATVGPQTVDLVGGNALGTLLTFDAVFTIDSPAGQVTGTKTLAFPVTDFGTQLAVGTCITLGDAEIRFIVDRFTVRYDAEISTGQGEFADRGLIPLVTVQKDRFVAEDRVYFQDFSESFQSDLTAPEPLTSPGQATGGGQIPGDVTFGLTAKSDDKGVKGNCTLIDRASGTTVKCLDATMYFQTATHAVFRGNALVNGTPTTYRITVDDNGEPGAGLDTFTISTGTGYGASGVLTQGNIQVHG